jgi:hypothetical protein
MLRMRGSRPRPFCSLQEWSRKIMSLLESGRWVKRKCVNVCVCVYVCVCVCECVCVCVCMCVWVGERVILGKGLASLEMVRVKW